MTKISSHIFHFTSPGRRFLREKSNYRQLYGEKKAGNAAESGIKILSFPRSKSYLTIKKNLKTMLLQM